MRMDRWNPWWTGDPDPTYLAWSRLRVRWVPDKVELVSLEVVDGGEFTGLRLSGVLDNRESLNG